MERVIQNLAINAMAYTPDGGRIVLRLRRDGDQLVFYIGNEGPALPGSLVGWINGEEGGRPERPAIGLTIVRRILTLHRFAFSAEVRDGINAFTIQMPVYKGG
jgi:signal transduction histidine kinase